MLTVDGLDQYYGQSHILWNVELEVPRGSCTCLMGRNGVGKTTLLRAIMGLLPIASGTLRFEEVDLERLGPNERARLGIAYVPQGREIFPHLSVLENLRTGCAARTDGGTEILPLVYELFPVLHDMQNRQGGNLSGGQQQQLAIGRALVSSPKLLILDEPTEGIQPNIVHQIGDAILELNRELGTTVLLVEQKLPFARRVADQFTILERGRSVASGAIDDLTDDVIDRHLRV